MRFPKVNLHTHTTYCDGKESVESMIQAAIATNDIDYIKGVAASLKAGDLTLGGALVPAAPAEAAPEVGRE